MTTTRGTTVGILDADPQSLAAKTDALRLVPGVDVRMSAESLGQMLTDPSFPPDVVIIEQRAGERVSINYKIRVCRLADSRVIVVDTEMPGGALAPDVGSLMTPVHRFDEAVDLIAHGSR